MNIRKYPLINNNIYHILNKSIEGFIIYNRDFDYHRMLDIIKYYQYAETPIKYSRLIQLTSSEKSEIWDYLIRKNNKIIDIISFCIMPTHYHLSLIQLQDNGISTFVSQIQNSYARYFNTKYDRKGPLWQGYFKNVLVETDAQLLHLSRYHHLNAVSAGLVENPCEWEFSSYREYIGKKRIQFCNYKNLLNINPVTYRKFVENRIDYQRALTKIKKIILE